MTEVDPSRRLRRRDRRRVRRRRRDLRQPDGAAADARRPAGPADQQPRPGHLRRRVDVPGQPAAAVRQGRRGRGLDPVPPGLRRHRLRQAARDDGRHPGRPARQPEHLRDRRLRPAEAAAARQPRRPRQHGQQPDVLLGAQALHRGSSSRRSTSSPASGPSSREGRRPRRLDATTTSTGSSPTSASSTSAAPTRRCGCSRCTRASPSTRCDEATGFDLQVDADGAIPETRQPTAEELVLINEVLDPKGLRFKEVPNPHDPPGAQDPVHRAGRGPPPRRADRHGLGLRPAAASAARRTPAASASWPAPR